MLLTPRHGRLDCVVKGGRKSRRGGLIEPFSYFDGQLRCGRGLPTLSEAQLLHGFPGLREDLDVLTCAARFLDLCSRIAQPEQDCSRLMGAVLSALYLLEAGCSPDVCELWLWLQFLEVQGLAPDWKDPILRHLSGCRADTLPRLKLTPAQVSHARQTLEGLLARAV